MQAKNIYGIIQKNVKNSDYVIQERKCILCTLFYLNTCCNAIMKFNFRLKKYKYTHYMNCTFE